MKAPDVDVCGQSAIGPFRSIARAAGSGVADSVQPIHIHSVADPALGWRGGARGAAKAQRGRQSRTRVPGAVNKNSLNEAGHPGMALLAPVQPFVGGGRATATGRKLTAA